MKAIQKLLHVGLVAILLWPAVGGTQPAPEVAKALARAQIAEITNRAARDPVLKDTILSSLRHILEYHQRILEMTNNWNEFIASTSGVPFYEHIMFQFYMGVRSNFDDLDPWDRLMFGSPLPVGEAELSPEEKGVIAERDKRIRVLWLKTILELGLEEVLRKHKYLPCGSIIGRGGQEILQLFDQPHLFGRLTEEDWEVVARWLDVFRALRNVDLLAIAIEHSAATGLPVSTNLIESVRNDLYCQYLPYIAGKVLRADGRNMPVNTNLLIAWLRPVAVWVENQCYELEELLVGVTNLYERYVYQERKYLLPHFGGDKRAFYGFRRGLEGMARSVAGIKRVISPVEEPRRPPELSERDMRMVRVVRAYVPFEPESPYLRDAFDAVRRGDLESCSEGLSIEFAVRNIYYPMELLASWAEVLCSDGEAREALSNIVTRLDRIAVILGIYEMLLPSPPYRRPTGSVMYRG